MNFSSGYLLGESIFTSKEDSDYAEAQINVRQAVIELEVARRRVLEKREEFKLWWEWEHEQ